MKLFHLRQYGINYRYTQVSSPTFKLIILIINLISGESEIFQKFKTDLIQSSRTFKDSHRWNQ